MSIVKPIKLFFVLGTRPEAIKLAPLIKRAKLNRQFEVVVCSTGQHREMLVPILKFFEISLNYDLDLMRPGQKLMELVSGVMSKLDSVLAKEKPDVVIVQGDTSTCMAAALVAFYNKIPVAHAEAGLRSGDLHSPWPEEFNRRAVSLTTQMHFAPTETSKKYLLKDGYKEDSIYVTGNTVIDALQDAVKNIEVNDPLLNSLNEKFRFLDSTKKLILVTTHRREGFFGGLESVFRSLLEISAHKEVQILFSVHLNPEVRKGVNKILGNDVTWVSDMKGPTSSRSFYLCDPLPYLDFVFLMKKSYFIMSDSGGVQEEAPALGKPVLVLREVTERPEAIEAGTSKLVGYDQKNVTQSALELLDDKNAYDKMARAHNPFGDGKASERILEILSRRFGDENSIAKKT